MAFSYTLETHTIVDMPLVPGTPRSTPDAEDRGGGVYPVVRAGFDEVLTYETIIDKTGGTIGLTLANIAVMIASLDNWTINGEGPAPITVRVFGDAVQVAEITLG